MRGVVILAMVLAPGVALGGMWEEVAGVGRGGDEKGLRTALAATPGDFEARRALAETLSAKKRTREAAREFELAVASAPTPADEARMWFRLANERTRLGAYDESLDAYEREIALGDTEPAALANSAELLMARGDLFAAVDRYREAVAIEERAPNRREHLQGMALGYFGLAVALDRNGAVLASREAMGRALALDPGLAVLRVAGQLDSADSADGDVFFVPRGEVFYYLALAREAQGRAADASAAFRDYLRVATGRYALQAREHLARLMGQATPGPARDRSPPFTARRPTGEINLDGNGRPPVVWRVLHEATLRADGPLVAPLVDATWRLHPRLLDACLLDIPTLPDPTVSGPEPGPSPRQWKVSLEMRIEDSGRVGAVAAKAPPELGEELPRCIETAVRQQFRVSRPARKKPTLVRMELVLAPAPAGGV